jgi:hypothetical protein
MISCAIRKSERQLAIILSIHPLLKNFVSVSRMPSVLICELAR